jgi:hypothetical protein
MNRGQYALSTIWEHMSALNLWPYGPAAWAACYVWSKSIFSFCFSSNTVHVYFLGSYFNPIKFSTFIARNRGRAALPNPSLKRSNIVMVPNTDTVQVKVFLDPFQRKMLEEERRLTHYLFGSLLKMLIDRYNKNIAYLKLLVESSLRCEFSLSFSWPFLFFERIMCYFLFTTKLKKLG